MDPALRAPDYIKAAARLIAAHGWCGAPLASSPDLPPTGLGLARAVTWAVAGRRCSPRELTADEADRVDGVLEHLEDAAGLGMPVSAFERRFAAANSVVIAQHLLVAAWRHETELLVGA